MRSRSSRLESLSIEAAEIRESAGGRKKIIWPARFRKTAVGLMRAGYLAPELASRLGVPVMTLYHWKQMDGQRHRSDTHARVRTGGAARKGTACASARVETSSGLTAVKITPDGANPSPKDEDRKSRRHSVSASLGLVASDLSLLELAWLWQYLLRLDFSDKLR